MQTHLTVALLACSCVAVRASEPETSIENSQVKISFTKEPYGSARVFARQGNAWTQVAVWRPLWRIASGTGQVWNAYVSTQHPKSAIELAANSTEWNLWLNVALEKNRPVARIHYRFEPKQAANIGALWGPIIHVGEGTTGGAKTWGLFPGLEYLFGGEPSSNVRDFAPNLADRRSPHPHKITIPLMAITIGPDSQKLPENADRFFTPDSLKDRGTARNSFPQLKTNFTVALAWQPSAKWDEGFPTPRFSSPDSEEGTHLMGLFLPSIPEFVSENADRATRPFSVEAGKPLDLEARLIVSPGPVLVAVREWLRDNGGLPKANLWPRSFQQELDVCRAGFLNTVWDEKSEKWRHCIGWAPSYAPGFASLLWWDSKLGGSEDARKQSAARVELAATKMLADGGPGQFCSQANCHTMQWEFPFIYGYLPEAFSSLDGQIEQLIQTQNSEGAWLYQPASKEQKTLGRAGDSVLGTCANRAATLLRFARITGDANALVAGEKALRFMEQFRVPRGGQTWECPMYEPDILAAAYAIRAYTDGYRATGNLRWLHNAVYWAETGVPFQYLWSLADKPMMLGASIPVFGSTFYKHSWLGMPVQWCGLVYARQLWQLAEELKKAKRSDSESPLPLALNFGPEDWRRMAELITVSGMHQQFDSGERIGAYPDSISKFEVRNPAFLNPEDILVNVLAMSGHDPDIKSLRVEAAGKPVTISSAARIKGGRVSADAIRFELSWFEGELSHSMISGLRTAGIIRVDGESLPQSQDIVRRQPGCYFDSKHQRIYFTVRHSKTKMSVDWGMK